MLFIGIQPIHNDRTAEPTPVQTPPHFMLLSPPSTPTNSFYDGNFFTVRLSNKLALALQKGAGEQVEKLTFFVQQTH